MSRWSIIISLVLFAISMNAQTPPEVSWMKAFGGSGMDWGYYAIQTDDGGYIALGRKDNGSMNMDAWLIKTDANGDTMWTKRYGDLYIDEAYVIKQTTDGGYIIAGASTAFGWHGEGWLIKTDSNGNIIWSKGYHPNPSSSTEWDNLYDVIETPDGGFVALGYGSYQDYYWQAWILKVNSIGNVVWNKSYGDIDSWERLYSFQPLPDGGYIAVGDKHYTYGDTTSHDGWLVRFSNTGDTLWTKHFGGTQIDLFKSIQITSDGGYIVCGEREPYWAGYYRGWLLKLDMNGNVIWENMYGFGGLMAVQETPNGNYIAAGTKFVSQAMLNDAWILKTDINGNVIYDQTYSISIKDDIVQSIQPTSDGGYILGGRSNSEGTIATIMLVKLDADETTTLTSFTENFDGVITPALPSNWSSCVKVLISNNIAEVKTMPHGSAPSQPNSTFIMNGLDGSNGQPDYNAFSALVSPLVQIGPNGGTVTFWATGGNPVKIGLMTNPTDTATFTLIEEIQLNYNFEQYSVNLPPVGAAYIAFKNGNVSPVTPIFIDDISFDQAGAPLISFAEYFDSVTPPGLPNGWTAHLDVLLSNSAAEVKTIMHGSAPSAPNTTFIMNGINGGNGQLDSAAFVVLVSPLVQIGTEGGQITFKANGGNPIVVGIMSDPNDASTFTAVQQIPLTYDFEQYSVNINFIGSTHIAFKHSNLNAVTPIFVDDIIFQPIVPVELVSFTGKVVGSNIELTWITATETNNMGFAIEKRSNDNWKQIGFVTGLGTTTETHNYLFTDSEVINGKNIYRLKQIDFDGSIVYSNEIEIDLNLPTQYTLEQNYPNPFNPSTTINFSLPVDARITIKVFSTLGELIRTITDSNFGAGYHTINFQAEDLVSGLYIYSIDAAGADNSSYRSVKKMMLIK